MESSLHLNFPGCLEADFPVELPVACGAVERLLAALGEASYDTLALHSPALAGNDWQGYLRCSLARMVHAAGAVRRLGIHGGRLLDYGAYFGNFAGMFADLGFQVDAVDAYRAYAPALAAPTALLQGRGIAVVDFDEVGRDLHALPDATYDVVIAAGIIEHVPHTPRGLLATLDRVLKPGGCLVLDTPNLAHVYKRQALARGESVWPPIAAQFHSPVPYEGHHREYTASELAWMLNETGHELTAIELYNYSVFGQPQLSGRDVDNFWRTVREPALREYITTTSRRADPAVTQDWRECFLETEPYWIARQPAPVGFDADAIDRTEPLLAQLQQAVALRDQMLAALHDERTEAVQGRDRTIAELNADRSRLAGQLAEERIDRDREIAARDRTIADLNRQIGDVQRRLDAKWSEVAKRQYHRFSGNRR